MRLVKRAAILTGLAAGAALMTASAALAHDDDHGRGWKRGHWHHHHDRYVFERSRPIIVERPVIYRQYREQYREVPMYPAYPAYPPGPPSLNINIPLR